MNEITTHGTGLGEINDEIRIRRMDSPGAGGGHHHYQVTRKASEPDIIETILGEVHFHHVFESENTGGMMPGVTNEVLLAIVEDRLACFQQGEFACEENAQALWNVKQARLELQRRTNRRKAQGVEGKLEKDKPIVVQGASSTDRVSKTATHLVIRQEAQPAKGSEGGKGGMASSIALESLKTWAGWDQVLKAVRYLDTSLTEAETALIHSCADTPAGKHGWTEFVQALGQSVKK